MKIDIADLKGGKVQSIPLHYTEAFEVSFLKGYGVTSAKELKVDGNVYAVDRALMVDVDYSIELGFNCGRCLKAITRTITGSLSLDLGKPADSGDLLIHQEMDLRPALEEDMILNMPLQVLCDEDCKGLCPTCGADLNIEKCNCNDDKIDPRLESLKNFFHQ